MKAKHVEAVMVWTTIALLWGAVGLYLFFSLAGMPSH